VREIVLTGCWSTLQPRAAADLPNVLRVVPNERKDFLVADVLNLPQETFDLEPLTRTPLGGLHHRTRAFIKVQDGCDNQCTFCITTVARGAGRSRAIQEVVADINAAVAGGTREVVLTGVHLGSWGHDFGEHLITLIRAILTDTDVSRLRLSSLEPWDLDSDFFSLWRDNRLMSHLHLPLQSGAESVLKRMRRQTAPDSFRALVAAARDAIPHVAITTDVIAGFPGETDDEFAQTLAFINEMDFAGGHVFTYSARPGTAAARMKNHIPMECRKERNAILRAAFSEMSAVYRKQFIGASLPVLWESVTGLGEQGWQMEGLTPNYIRVNASAAAPRWNQVDRVTLTGLTLEGALGELVL